MGEHEALIRNWFDEVWNKKRSGAIGEMLGEDCIHRGLGGTEATEVRGTQAFTEFHKAFITAFPDLEVTVDEVIESGNRVVARCTVRGTHTGDGLGFPGTAAKVEFTGLGLGVVRDGRFVEVWNEYDFLKMYHQLGVLTLRTG